MIKAIIFDCFGVLATEAWLSFKTRHFSHDNNLFEQASRLSKQADIGLIGYGDFIRAVAGLAGITASEAQQAIRRNVPDKQLFDYIRELKTNYKIGFLSNIAANYLKEIFTSEELALFDGISLSYKTGFIKPDAQAFEISAQQLGVDTRECIFVDDQERNVGGAKKTGMQAILYHNAARLRQELDPLLV